MRTVLLLLLLILPFTIKAQSLNKLFLIPSTVTTLVGTLLIDQDTIVALGNVIDEPGRFGLHLSKYDTLGNLLYYKTYFHPQGKPYFLRNVAGLIKTSDGGYFAVADINQAEAMVIFKFTHSGDLEWRKEVDDINLRAISGYIPVECSDGYLIPGLIQYENYDANGAIWKIDHAGNLVWRKDYGVNGPTDFVLTVVKKDDNSFFVSGGQNNPVDVNDPDLWSRSWIFEIDSTGTVLSEWKSEIAENLTSCIIQLSGENELVFLAGKFHLHPGDATTNEFILRKLDINDWHTVWQTSQTGPEVSYFGSWQHLAQNPVDGAWDVVGTYQHYQLPSFVKSGIIAHVKPEDGSTIWLRKDTAYISPLINFNENRLLSVGHLSSGSIIAGGWVLSVEGGDLHQEAWLLKLSPDGCIEPGDCALSPTHEPGTASGPSFLKWETFPNPATHYALLMPDKDLQGQTGSIALFNAQGKLVRESIFQIQAQQPIKIDLLGLSPGAYNYQVLMDNKIVGGGKIIHQN